MYDPNSPNYKKARKLHLKTTKNRPADIEDGWTPFRTMEKKFKAKWPPPDLRGVLDLSQGVDMDIDGEEGTSQNVHSSQGDVFAWRQIKLDTEERMEGKGERRAYVVPSVPGAKPVSYTSAYVRTYSIHDLSSSYIGTWSCCEQA